MSGINPIGKQGNFNLTDVNFNETLRFQEIEYGCNNDHCVNGDNIFLRKEIDAAIQEVANNFSNIQNSTLACKKDSYYFPLIESEKLLGLENQCTIPTGLNLEGPGTVISLPQGKEFDVLETQAKLAPEASPSNEKLQMLDSPVIRCAAVISLIALGLLVAKKVYAYGVASRKAAEEAAKAADEQAKLQAEIAQANKEAEAEAKEEVKPQVTTIDEAAKEAVKLQVTSDDEAAKEAEKSPEIVVNKTAAVEEKPVETIKAKRARILDRYKIQRENQIKNRQINTEIDKLTSQV